ncbi:MAG TPA: S8 family serine peptidase [Burkholderiaceae bacterium]|mgnify:CR=1 FL=1|nr:S8 family serine peptidase [Burkholderiaceae bacterium]
MALTLAGCGGGGGGGGTPASSGSVEAQLAPGTPLNASTCTYHYLVTNNPVLTGGDPLLARQWHLNNTGQSGGTAGEDIRALTAWQAAPALGAGVRISVIDDAVEIVHNDLAPNVTAGASRNYRSDGLRTYPLPCDGDQEHGTAVAGIAAARNDNGVGGTGVAPRASIVAFNALATNFDTDIADALQRDLPVNGVYNNSWGSSDDGRLHKVDTLLKSAVTQGLISGRDGKGAIYVFPGGNGGCLYGANIDADDLCLPTLPNGSNPGGWSDNSNFDGYVNRYGVITACAVTDRGKKPWYGEPGANLLVCGTSSNDQGNVTTTDVQNGFRDDFSGTSATAPMVSGVVALMLSVRPELTYRDVMLILARTARRNDPADTGWISANGLNFNHKYGFGVVDANAAVQAAKSFTSVGGYGQVVNCGWYRQPVGQPLPDFTTTASPVTSAILVGTDCPITKIEFIEIGLEVTHAYSGDLRIRLTSPNGLVSELANERICKARDGTTPEAWRTVSCGQYDADWLFGSVRHLDESAAGNWTLQIADYLKQDTGTWTNWSIRIWGRP